MTLTTRLSVFFLGTLAAVLLGFSTTLYLLAHTYLHRQIEDRLEAALERPVGDGGGQAGWRRVGGERTSGVAGAAARRGADRLESMRRSRPSDRPLPRPRRREPLVRNEASWRVRSRRLPVESVPGIGKVGHRHRRENMKRRGNILLSC